MFGTIKAIRLLNTFCFVNAVIIKQTIHIPSIEIDFFISNFMYWFLIPFYNYINVSIHLLAGCQKSFTLVLALTFAFAVMSMCTISLWPFSDAQWTVDLPDYMRNGKMKTLIMHNLSNQQFVLRYVHVHCTYSAHVSNWCDIYPSPPPPSFEAVHCFIVVDEGRPWLDMGCYVLFWYIHIAAFVLYHFQILWIVPITISPRFSE